MNNSITVENILSQIKRLDYEARLNLAEKLAKQIKGNKKQIDSSIHRLTELSGLGSEIWRDVDIDQYLQQERQWD